jgi:caffeoyl-CoA O-methyltransferase
MNITNEKIEEYLSSVSTNATVGKNKELLEEMRLWGVQNGFPIIGPLVGRFLRQLAITINAKTILEMGSGFGYSAMWFAGGMGKGGKIICTDGSEDNHKRAMEYFGSTDYGNLIEYHVGDALEIAKTLTGPFDIILNDVDKEQYPEAFDLAVPLLRKGGIFITDNVLWSGRIFDKKPDESTNGVLEFNRKLFSSQDVLASIMPIRDGLGIAVKL